MSSGIPAHQLLTSISLVASRQLRWEDCVLVLAVHPMRHIPQWYSSQYIHSREKTLLTGSQPIAWSTIPSPGVESRGQRRHSASTFSFPDASTGHRPPATSLACKEKKTAGFSAVPSLLKISDVAIRWYRWDGGFHAVFKLHRPNTDLPMVSRWSNAEKTSCPTNIISVR